MTDTNEDEDAGEGFTCAITPDLAGTRLDKALAVVCPEFSRTRLKALIDDSNVTVNGKVCDSASYSVQDGDEISFILPPLIDSTPQPENIPLDVIYEDEDMLVINKPAGLVVHPGAGNWTGTLVNALLHHCGDSLSGIGGVARPGIVHRLDKETSGLMVVAKNDRAHRGLTEQLSDRTLSRVYKAIVWNVPMPKTGIVNEPIGRDLSNRLKMAAKQGGREAITRYRVLQPYGTAAALVECRLETGRTHQIRVHMRYIKHPLVGDTLYGLNPQEARSLLRKAGVEDVEDILAFPRQALHAAEIGFLHPLSGEEMGFEADWPKDFKNLENLFKSIY